MTTQPLFPILGQEEQEPLVNISERIEVPNPVLQTNTDPDIRKHFPFPTMRDAQSQALTVVVKSAEEKKKFTLIEAPVGVGKSGIAIAAGSWAKTQPLPVSIDTEFQPGASVLSTQKTLTQQYMREFGPQGLVELKGRANYACARHETDCATAATFQDEEDNCSKAGVCTYGRAKKEYMSSLVRVTNFSYFLTEGMYAGRIKPTNYLILDECHNVENQLLGFTDTEFTPNRAGELDVTLPVLKPGAPGNTEAARQWLENTAYPKIADLMAEFKLALQEAKADNNRQEAIRMAKKLDSWENFKHRLGMFTTTERPQDWFAYSDINPRNGKGSGNLIIKPLTATLFADDLMFRKAANVIMMSATILDFRTFMRNLGIDPAQTNTVAIPSDFPIENRPIFYKPVGNMGWKTKEQAIPEVAKYMLLLLEKKYSHVKGIIHSQSYDNTRYFIEYLRANGQGHRLITHTNLPGSREEAIAKHAASPEPTVLISPSMTEGLDLKDDLARFCIVPKVPYPALDPYTKARMERDPDWYQWQTALALIQGPGRIVRSKTDKGHTWILDEGFGAFLAKNESKLPTWWTNSIIFR